MALYLVFNECVVDASLTSTQASQAVDSFAATFRGALRVRGDLCIVAPNLTIFEVAPGFRMSAWGRASGNKDSWELLLRAATRAPLTFHELQGEYDDGGTEYEMPGDASNPGIATLALAHAMRTFSISVPTAAQWELPRIPILIRSLDDEGSVVEDIETIANLSTTATLAGHATELGSLGVIAPVAGSDIWNSRAARFPRLTFLDRVRGDLESLKASWVSAVNARLEELQSAAASWDIAAAAQPSWRSVITPESSTRRDGCLFLDGEVLQNFEMHARFTPGAGRIHFRLDRQVGEIRVGYIGQKIGE